MIPVLAVTDPLAARLYLEKTLGFRAAADGHMAFGDTEIAVVAADARPDDLIAMEFDHIAFQVPDADACCRRCLAAGAGLDRRFTPDGPRDIPEFWTQGVRFVFFTGPEGAPFEFCARNDPSADQGEGHSHFALRSPSPDALATCLLTMGAREIASHTLAGQAGPVSVRFLQSGKDIFELFDDPPFAESPASTGWIGLLPDRLP